ncbi:transposase [Streptomyces sp. NPDC005908]|uniref:transposase n=1 Tax=Streptomyces sp. NPDC005908 TaxID=3157084 RepID=UPI0033DE3D12
MSVIREVWLMLDGRPKSIWPMAEHLPDGGTQALQQFVSQFPWGPLPVRQRMAERLSGVVRPEVGVIDEVSFPSAARHRWKAR